MSNIPEDLYPVKYDPLTPITTMMAMAKKVVQSHSPIRKHVIHIDPPLQSQTLVNSEK